MRRFARWMFAAVGVLAVVALVADPMMAQEQQRGRQRQGQRGQRGRGGQRGQGFGRGGFGFGGGSLGLLGIPQVQTELKMTDEQKAGVEKITADQRTAFGELRDIEDRAERGAKMRELSEKASKDAEALLKEDQKKRLAEIQLQMNVRFRGAAAQFSEEETAKKLKLSDEQKGKLAELTKATADEMAKAREDLEGRELFTKMGTLREEESKKAVALLNEDQKAAWTAMLGKPFELQFGGFGGRGRGGRGGQGGERRRPQSQ